MNIQVVAGKATRVNTREIKERTLTTVWIEGFDFSILVWDNKVSFKEGDFLFVEGRVQSRSYEKDGEKKYVTEIIAHRVINLSMDKAGNVTLALGNLGRDPQMKYTPDGKAVTDATMAAHAFGAEKPEWFNLTAWEKVAEIMNQFLEKGRRLVVVGRLIKESWEGKGEHQGKSFHRTKLIVNDMLMIGGSSGGNGNVAEPMPENLDEIPF